MRKFYALNFLVLVFVLGIGVEGWGQINEGFESGLPSSYDATLTTRTLSSGQWQMHSSYRGNCRSKRRYKKCTISECYRFTIDNTKYNKWSRHNIVLRYCQHCLWRVPSKFVYRQWIDLVSCFRFPVYNRYNKNL